jgi:hypothetical protein
MLFCYFHNTIGAQDLEVAGKAKIGNLDEANTADSVLVLLSDGTLARRDASTLPVAGTTAGEMLYWNGAAWVTVAPGNEGEVLTFTNGVPTWTAGEMPPPIESTDATNPLTGKVWMDRNLGALREAISYNDSIAFGGLFQWGRSMDGHQSRSSGTTTQLSNSDLPSDTRFILAPGEPGDWRSTQKDSLWQGVNGINNPCPTGYRIPTATEWDNERSTWISNDRTGAYASPLRLPAGGGRARNVDFISGSGSKGSYWSSTVIGISARYLNFSSTGASLDNNYRAEGFSVRCIKD